MAKTYNQIKQSVLGKSYNLRESDNKTEKTYDEIKSGVKNGKYNFSRIKADLEKKIGLDTFESDISSMGKTIGDVGANWQTQEMMSNSLSTIESMQTRLSAYKEYQRLFGNKDTKGIDTLQSDIRKSLDNWDSLAERYGKYKSADAYKAEQTKLNELYGMSASDVEKAKQKNNSLEEILNTAKEYERNVQSLQVKKNTWGHRTNGLNTDDGYTSKVTEAENELNKYLNSVGYSSVDEIEKAWKRKDIAYTTADGYNIKWDDLYNDAHLNEYTQEIKNNPDFTNTSDYKKKDVKYTYHMGYGVVDNEFAHIYNLINGDEDAKEYETLNNVNMYNTNDSIRYEYFTPEEKMVFNSIAETQGEEKALEYAEKLSSDLRQRRVQHERILDAEYAQENPVGSSIVSVLSNVGNNALALPFMAMDYAEDGSIDENSSLYSGRRQVNTTRSTVENTIDNEVGQFFYRHGMNTADNIAAMAVSGFGKLGVASKVIQQGIMSSGAVVDTAIDAKSRGLSDGKAIGLGMIAGAAEWYFESKGFDALFDTKTLKQSGWKYFVNNLKTEMVGELGTELTNDVADVLLSKELSQWRTDINSYIASGMTEKEAFVKAFNEAGVRYLDVAAGTLFSTGVISGTPAVVGSIGQHYSDKSTGKNIRANERVTDLFDIASNPEVASAYEAYTQYANKGINADNIKDAQIGNLYSKVRTDAQETLQSEEATEEQKSGALRTLTKLATLDTDNVVAKEKKKLNVGEETKVTESGSAIAIQDLRIQGEDIKVATENGDISVDDMTLSDGDADIVARAKVLAKTEGEDVANLFISQYDGKTNIDEYANDFELVSTLSKLESYKPEQIFEAKGVLSTEQAKEIYKTTIKAQETANRQAREEAFAKMRNMIGKQGVVDDSVISYDNKAQKGKVNWNELKTRQRKAITLANGFFTSLGSNVVWTNKYKHANGMYSVEGDTIFIDVYAGVNLKNLTGDDTIINTISHELTHQMEVRSPETFNEVKELVLDTLEAVAKVTDKSVTRADLISKEIKRLDEKHPEKKHTEAEAISELVAKACEDMLSKSQKGIELFNSLSETEQKTLTDKIRDIIRKLKDWVSELLKTYSSKSEEAIALRNVQETFDEVLKRWDMMLADIAEQNKARKESGAVKKETSAEGDVLEQAREIDANGNSYWHIETDKDIFKGITTVKGLQSAAFNYILKGDKGSKVFGLVDGKKLEFIRVSAEEYVYGKASNSLTQEEYKQKMRMATSIIDLIENASIEYDAPDHKTHKLFPNGFKNYQGRVGIDETIFKYIVRVGKAKNGTIFYDINLEVDGRVPRAKSTSPIKSSTSKNIILNSDRNVNTNFPTKDSTDKDIRFSMRDNVEETKDLIAVHNMQVSELERTLDLGGLPMPSIAIIKAKSGHSEYGDVSLVFGKETIDPKASRLNKVYGGDAWTPTYPTIEYKPNAKVAKKISDKYYEFSKKFGYDESRPLYNYVYDMEDILNRHKGEAEMIAELYEDEKMMQVYLLDSGKSKVETIQKEISTELTDAEVGMNEFFITELGADVVNEVMWDGNGTPMTYRKNYLSKYEDAIREAYKKLLSEEYHFTEEQVQNVMDSTKASDLIKFMRDAHKYRENGRVTTRTEDDYEATKEAIKNEAGEGYRKWIDSLFKGIEEKSGIRNNVDYFTNSGNRRSWEALHWENNLENVVKVMKSQDDVGSGAIFSGHSIWGVAAKDYRSIEEIKADSDRLKQLPEEEYNKIKESFGERLQEIAHSIMDKSERNPFIASDNAMTCIVEAVRNSKTKSGILNNLKQYRQLSVTETTVDDIVSLVTDISNMPTEYFEAKPKRAVELNEIATVIIPDKTSDDTKARLDNMGIKYLEYESGNEQSRLDALNSLEEVRFSDRDAEYGDRDYITYNSTAILKESTIDLYLRDYASESSPNYAQAYIAYMSPSQYLKLTTSNKAGQYQIEKESKKFDREQFEKATHWQPIQLKIDHKSGEVLGHEGRHRMVALANEGIYNVPVLLFDSSNKSNKETIKDVNLNGQFNEYHKAIIEEAIPLSYANRDAIIKKFGTKSSTQKLLEIDGFRETLQYSDRDDTSIYDIMGETERILKENEKFKAEIERLKERLKIERKVTNGSVLNNNQLLSAAGHLRNISNSTIDKVDLARSLKDVYSFIKNTENPDAEEIFEKSYRIAEAILAEAKPDVIVDDYYKQILKDIRNTRISLSESQKTEAQNIFDKNWNRYFFGNVIITDNGVGLESKWQEWASQYPGVFDADISDGDMVGELYDIISTLREASETVVEYNEEERKVWLANEIYNQYWNVSPIVTTADKYNERIKQLNFEHRKAMAELRNDYKARLEAQKLADDIHYGKKVSEVRNKTAEVEEQRKADREKFQKLYEAIRERKDNEIALAKLHGRERLASYKENAERKTILQSMTSTVMSLNKKLSTNSKDVHIPESLKPVVINLLNSIDFSSKQALGMSGTKKDARGTLTKSDIAIENALSKAHSMESGKTDSVSLKMAIQDALELFENAEKVRNMSADGTIDGGIIALDTDMIDNIKAMLKKLDILANKGVTIFVLQEMSTEHLKVLNGMVKSINHWAIVADKALANKHKERITDIAMGTVDETKELGERQGRTQGIESIKNFINWSHVLPTNAFKRFGKNAMKIFSPLRSAEGKLAFNKQDIMDFMERLLKEYKEYKPLGWRTDIKSFELNLPNGNKKTVKMPVSFIMSLYCVSKQEDAKRHLYGEDALGNKLIYTDEKGNEHDGGGMTIAEFKDGKFTTKVSKDLDNTIVTDAIVKQITGVLTKEQMEFADALQKYMNEKGAEWGNAVSEVLHGIKKFGIEDYFPLKVSSHELSFDKVRDERASLFSILNYGFTKERNPNAKQSIEIGDIFDVFANHMHMVAIYNAYALPVFDIARWFNFKGKTNDGDRISVTKSIEEAFGKGALTYVDNLIKDLNGQHTSSRLGFITKIFKNTKVAMVGNSISVALLQPTAYFKAMVKIPPKYLLKSALYVKDFGAKNGVRKAKKYCGIALLKSQGYFETGVSANTSKKLIHDESWMEKRVEKSLFLAGFLDERTWGVLWNACEFETRAKRKDLKVGSEEFNNVVGEKLADVIYETQVVDSPLAKSDLMRSGDTGSKMITMFAGEMTTAYNLVFESAYQTHLDAKRYGLKESLKKNKKSIVMTLMAYTLTSAIGAAVSTATQNFFDDDDEEKDFEDYLKQYLTNFFLDWLIIGKIPYLKESVSFYQGYSSSNPMFEWLESGFKAYRYWMKVAEGKDEATMKAFDESLKTISYAGGYGLFNQWKNLRALLKFVGIMD